MLGRREHQRAGLEHVRQRARIVLRVRLDLREGDVAGGVDELAELAVRHRRAVDEEAIDGDAMDRRLLRIMMVGSHVEGATRNPDHVWTRRHLGRWTDDLCCSCEFTFGHDGLAAPTRAELYASNSNNSHGRVRTKRQEPRYSRHASKEWLISSLECSWTKV